MEKRWNFLKSLLSTKNIVSTSIFIQFSFWLKFCIEFYFYFFLNFFFWRGARFYQQKKSNPPPTPKKARQILKIDLFISFCPPQKKKFKIKFKKIIIKNFKQNENWIKIEVETMFFIEKAVSWNFGKKVEFPEIFLFY